MVDNRFPLYAFAFLSTFVLTFLIGRLIIPVFSKKAQQPIYKEGPSWHISKSGTPTMGGLSFLIGVLLSLLICSLILYFLGEMHSCLSLLILAAYALLNSLIGIIDDITKLKRRENAGLTPMEKLILQFLSASAFLFARVIFLNAGTAVAFSFGTVDIGVIYYPLALLILVGLTNFANLTDGVDGLATGVAFSVALSLFYISCALSTEVSIISTSIMGATCAFLLFNLHPARIFMGDTGSLFLGSVLSAAAFLLNNPLIIICLGGVYVIEGASVVLQVAAFKLTGKRIFKMAPLHHHLERCGWTENKICIAAIIITLILSIPVYVFYLP